MKREKLERALKGSKIDGAPSWYGQFRDATGRWWTVRNNSNLPIVYADAAAARKAAEFVGAAWRINERKSGEAPYTPTEAHSDAP